MNIMDAFNRESLAIEVNTSLPLLKVIRVLGRLIELRGYLGNIRCDNGHEFIRHSLNNAALTKK